MTSSGRLFFSDFSRIQFGTISGPTLPRRQKVRMNNLLGRDNGDEIIIDPSGVSLPTLEEIINEQGLPNEVRKTSGFAASPSPFDIYFSPAPATVDNVDVFASFPGVGSWRRIKYGAPAIRSTKIVGNGSVDDTAAFENMMAAACKKGKDVVIDSDDVNIRITDTVVISEAADNFRFRIRARGGENATASTGAKFVWDGADDRPMFLLQSSDVAFEKISFYTRVDCKCLVNFAQSGRTRPSFTKLNFGNLNASSSSLLYGFATDLEMVGMGNCDEAIFDGVVFAQCVEACVWIRGGQPYATKFRNCSFLNLGVDNDIPSGIGIRLSTPTGSVVLENPTFGRLSTAIYNESDSVIQINGMVDSEHVKRLYWAKSGSSNVGKPFAVRGGRLGKSVLAHGRAAFHPSIAADDERYILVENGNAHSVRIEDADLAGTGYQAGTWMDLVHGAALELVNCILPNSQFLTRSTAGSGAAMVGRTYVRGCRAMASPEEKLAPGFVPGNEFVSVPDRFGSENGEAATILEENDSYVNIVFPTPELSVPSVECVATAETGTPASLAVTTSAITAAGFTATLGAAPGAGASVRITYSTKAAAPVVQVPRIERTFTGVKRASSSGAGAPGSAAGCWWSWIATCHATAGAGDEVFAAHRDSAGTNGWLMVNPSGGSLQIYLHSGGATASISGGVSLTIGKSYLFSIVYTGTQCVVYRNGALITTAAAAFAPASAERTCIGSDDWALNNLVRWSMHSFANGHGVPTASDVASQWAYVRAARDMQPMAGTGVTNTHRWRLNGSATASDLVGSSNITTVSGTLLTRLTGLDFT